MTDDGGAEASTSDGDNEMNSPKYLCLDEFVNEDPKTVAKIADLPMTTLATGREPGRKAKFISGGNDKWKEQQELHSVHELIDNAFEKCLGKLRCLLCKDHGNMLRNGVATTTGHH